MNRTRLMTCFLNCCDYSNQMTNIINTKRIDQITIFLKSLNIKSKRFSEIIKSQNISIIQNFNEAFIHSSENKILNYEKLEFFGDAVLRLAASNFIEKKYPKMSVGERSELRAQIVSDEWLTKLGEKIDIEKVIIKGPKALGDENSKNTIIGEATDCLLYTSPSPRDLSTSRMPSSA